AWFDDQLVIIHLPLDYIPEVFNLLFGTECCLSTGDLMKIVDISITKFIAHTADSTEIKLPLDYPGIERSVNAFPIQCPPKVLEQ
uniref:CABIT domain-containing protein n=1 Tax=Astyanax mexicanus TaxID=7994 RepID=A0A8B9GTP0_ASTMX